MTEQEELGNLIIEARKKNPDVPASKIHDLILARAKKAKISRSLSNGNGSH